MELTNEKVLLRILLQMRKKTIAFDLDGTLIDVSQRDYNIYSDLVIGLNGQPISFDIYWQLRRKRTDIHKILYYSGISTDNAVSFFIQEREHMMENPKYLRLDTKFPKVDNTLLNLSCKYDICILTRRNNQTSTKEQLQTLGLSDYPCFITNSDKEQEMHRITNIYAMVGDTESDIIPANRIGIISVAVLSGIRDLSLLETMSPTYILNSVADLSRLAL